MAKKILIACGVFIVLLVLILLALPMFFKPQIVEKIKVAANQQLNATLNFQDVDLSFFSSFPQVDLEINGLTIVNHDPFAGDTLASIESFVASVNWRSLMNGVDAIDGLELVRPRLLLQTDADGKVSWDIVKASEEAVHDDTTSAAINLSIQEYMIREADVRYTDHIGNIALSLSKFNHRGSGDFTADKFTLNTQTDIAAIDLNIQGNSYLNQAELSAKVAADIDLAHKRYTLKENSIRLNQLVLALDGWLGESEKGTQLNFTFDAPTVSLHQLLSLVPQFYRNDYQALSADGQVRTAGFVKGMLTENTIPSFDVDLSIANGRFSYQQQGSLPVNDIQLSLNVKNPGNTADQTLINLRNLHFELLNRKFDAQFFAKTPVSDPFVSGKVRGQLDLADVAKALSLPDSLQLNGKLAANLEIDGYPSAIEKKQSNRFAAKGDLTLNDIIFAAKDLPDPVKINSAVLQLTPSTAVLQQFSATSGKTMLQAQGQLDNIIGYFLGGDVLTGALDLRSELVDLNPIIAGESEELVAVELPDRVEFLLTSDFKKVLMDKLEITNLKGDMLLKDRKLTLVDLNMDMLRGHVIANGSYSYLPPAKPVMFFNLDVARVSIADLFTNMMTVRKVAPIAEFMAGDLNGRIDLNSELDETLTPVWSQFFSKGGLEIPKVTIRGFEPFNKASEILKLNALHNPAINDFAPSYEVKNGRFYVKPTEFKIGKYNVVASGSNGFDKSLDYQLQLQVPAADLKQTVNSQLSGFLKKDLSLLTNETVNITLNLGGNIANPSVKTSGANILKSAADPLKIAAQQEVDKQKEAAQAAANAELEKKKAAAQAALEKEKAELEKKKQEAKNKLKNKLKGLFDDK